jgi:hypothetical protein
MTSQAHSTSRPPKPRDQTRHEPKTEAAPTKRAIRSADYGNSVEQVDEIEGYASSSRPESARSQGSVIQGFPPVKPEPFLFVSNAEALGLTDRLVA